MTTRLLLIGCKSNRLNKFAETNLDIVEGMERAAATLSAIGMDEVSSFGLFTGAQEVIQNAETVGVSLVA